MVPSITAGTSSKIYRGSFSPQEYTYTKGLEDCSHVPFMIEKMKEAGFSEKELEMICTGNWHDLIRRVIG